GGTGEALSGGSLNAREDLFDIPGGTLKNNEIFKDTALKDIADKSPAGNELAGAAYIREHHMPGWDEQEWMHLNPQMETLRELAGHAGELDALNALRQRATSAVDINAIDQRINEIVNAQSQLDDLAVLNDLKNKSERLSNFVRTLDPRYALEGRDYFSTNAL